MNTKVNSAFHSSGVGKSSTGKLFLAEVQARRIYSGLVAGNTVWSHMAGDPLQLSDEKLYPF